MRKQKAKKVRLPSYFKPDRYKITLHPDLEKGIFVGEEVIGFLLEKSVNKLVLHANELEIISISAKIGNETVRAKSIYYDKKNETITFHFNPNLSKGKGKLFISFTGVLNDEMTGFYRSRYTLHGKEHLIATTQFEPTHARRAFPCVDEPSAKAVFDIILIAPKGYKAISNTIPSLIRSHDKNHDAHEFTSTPKMSTYLAAFIVGKFEWIEKKTKKGTLIRVFVTPGKKRQAEFALEVGSEVLDFFEEYFAIKYPLPVLDMIAIPDFSAGAMENWGAITYRETALLFDRSKSSTATKQRVAMVIAHELAHQWFGNLVTMEWWTHLWLNEGFASYIEYLALNKIFPQWDIWTQFVYSDLNQAMNLDSLDTTHPIEVDVHHPQEIGEIFDAISYHKGASVIRMIADYLGEKDFRDGLRHYLKKHQYSNASTEDLWLALEHISDKPVKSIMNNWTSKSGFPLITITNDKNKIKLQQSRFFSSSVTKKKKRDKTIWKIPMNVKRGVKSNIEKILLDKKTKLLNYTFDETGWISFNSGTSGMYRIKYPKMMLGNLEDALKKKILPARDRFAIQSDTFALTESGEFTSISYLDLAKAYKEEDDYTVWASLLSNLNSIKILLEKEHHLKMYRDYMRKILIPISNKVGWVKKRNEKHTTAMLRALILSNLGYSDDKKTVKKAFELFEKMKEGDETLSPDLKGVVYSLVAKNGGSKEYQWFIDRHEEETLQEEKNRILSALASFKSKKLIKKALNYSFSKKVRPQDTFVVFVYMWGNRFARELIWAFTKSHWSEILKRYGKGGHMLTSFVENTKVFSTNKRAREVRNFFQAHKAPGAERTVKQVVEKIYSNASWVARDKKKVIGWLKKNSAIE